jgi:ABC-type amino acid transport substrate-binding protein
VAGFGDNGKEATMRLLGQSQRRGSAVLVACMAAAPAAADVGPSPPADETPKPRVLRVLTVEADSAYSFSSNPETPGFDREIMEGFARLQRLQLEIVMTPDYDRLIPLLLAGKGDVIAGPFTITETRKQQIAFTTEVLPTRSVVVTRAPHPIVKTLEALRRERVNVIKGTSMMEMLMGLGVPISTERPSAGVTAAGLRAGQITCIVQDVQTAITDQRDDPEIQLGMFVGPPASYAYGVRKTDGALLSELNSYLTNIRRSGGWNRLVVKYYGEAAIEVLRRARTPE